MPRMRPLRLHTKTTLLVSAITLAVLLAVLLLVSTRMVNLVRDEERALAQLQAVSLAEQTSLMTLPRDSNRSVLIRRVRKIRRPQAAKH